MKTEDEVAIAAGAGVTSLGCAGFGGSLGVVGATVVVVLAMIAVCMGPAGLKTSTSGWWASAYGSDWLVVQYAQSGCVLNRWDLHDRAVYNEGNSDGIYFVADDGSVVHLGGHYVYVQRPSADLRDQLLATGSCAATAR